MKLFLRGGVGLIAVLFASFLIFNAQPLSAIQNPSPEPAQQQEQQEKKESAGKAQEKQAEHVSAPSGNGELSGTVSGTPAAAAVKDNDATAAASVKVLDITEANRAPLIKPQAFTAFSYSLRGRGSSGLGVRRGTIAADPRVLPYGTRVYLEMGSYSGEYLVTDAGTAIKGNKIDVWVPTIHEARRFGRKNVKLTILSYGARKAKARK